MVCSAMAIPPRVTYASAMPRRREAQRRAEARRERLDRAFEPQTPALRVGARATVASQSAAGEKAARLALRARSDGGKTTVKARLDAVESEARSGLVLEMT